jgi:heat shock protein HslJ
MTIDRGRRVTSLARVALAIAVVSFADHAIARDGRQDPPPKSDARPTQAPSVTLEGTRWHLVKFQGSDDTTVTPDDGSKYTLEFAAAGRVNVRIDCNRGRGAWKSAGPGQLAFGPLALTRAECPKGSMHDRVVKHWTFVRSYLIREADRHLFLGLMADGGSYEFEAAPVSTK